MANTIPVDDVVAASLGLIEASSVLGNLVYRDAERGFSGGTGDTVRVRMPTTIAAQDGTGADTVYSDVNDTTVPVTLSAEAYSAVKLTDKELFLDIADLGAQVLAPQAAGIAKYNEQAIAEVMNSEISGTTNTIDPASPLSAVSQAAAEFTRRELPHGNRNLVIGPDLEEAFLNAPQLQDASAAGDPDAIRRGRLAKIMGFDVYVSAHINGAVAFVREAFALASRAPLPPEGAGYAEARRWNGYTARYVRQFDVTARADVSIMSTFVGATVLDSNRAMPFGIAA